MVTAAPEKVATLRLRGGNQLAYDARDPEILVEGPAGTGKTRTILELFNNLCHTFDGTKALVLRKHKVQLATTCIATYREKVLTPEDNVTFFGGNDERPPAYEYANGSAIVLGGMDDPGKTLSSEYDIIFVNEATELTLEDWETLKRPLRHGVLRYQRLIGDCNPSHDKHWLLARCASGLTRRIKTTLKDNPEYYDEDGNETQAGAAYIHNQLEGMTGTRRQRLLLGEWVGMENAIYESLDRDKHVKEIPEGMTWGKAAVGIDYGTVHISAVVVVQKDSSGRIWARECWTGGEEEDPIVDIARSYKRRYNASVGVVDPIPAMQMLADKLGFIRSGESTKGSRGSEGSRIANIMRVKSLLGTDALRFDLNGPGIADLFAEAQMYRWLHKDTENIEKYVVDRHNDDRVAALEYAIEALETTQPSATGIATVAVPVATTQRQHVGGIGKARQTQPQRVGGLRRG